MKLFPTRQAWREHMISIGRIPSGEAARAFLQSQKLRRIQEDMPEGILRHEAALELLQQHYPGFDYRVEAGIVVYDNYPTVNGHEPTIADLVANALRISIGQPPLLHLDPFPPKILKRVRPLLSLGEAGKAFARFLVQHCILPNPQVMPAMVEWLRRALAGEESTFFTVVCPDYSYRMTGDPQRPYEYTFSGIGTGVGLVAQRIVALLPEFWEFCTTYNISMRFIVAIGDDEADSEETLHRVEETRESFLQKLRLSQNAFAQALPSTMPLSTPFVTEVDVHLWRATLLQAVASARQGALTGVYTFTAQEQQRTELARASLYKRWYGEQVNVRQCLVEQAPSYMTSGCLLDHLPNAIYLGGDSAAMAPFVQGLGTRIRPVVYLRSREY